jgi:hypothetical protein
LGAVVVAGTALVPPEAVYLVVIVLGVLLLQRPKSAANPTGQEAVPTIP